MGWQDDPIVAPAASTGAGWQSDPVVAPAAPAQAAPAEQPRQTDNYVQQGMSGLNEGIANTLGAPVEITSGLINAATTGANKLFGTNIPQIEHPALGQEFFHNVMAPTIKPESADPGQRAVRRIAQEVGATLIPGMKPIAMAEKPAQMALQELAAALGSGGGAAAAEQLAPGNSLAELAGQVVGGMTPGGVSRALMRRGSREAIPTLDEMRATKDAAYSKVDQSGVTYDQPTYINMLSKIGQEANADHISPTRHSAAYSFITDMASRAGQPMSLTELDQLRQEVRRDLITPAVTDASKAADAHFGQIVLDNIDEMIASDTRGGTAITAARAANTKLRKAELLADALTTAKRNAASSGSGGNINNAVRQQVKGILTNPKKVRSFTAEERATMEELVKQGKLENFLRLVGKLSPSGNGLMAALGIGGTAMNPVLALAPGAGLVAKALADRGTLSKASVLDAMVRRGGAVPAPRPVTSPAVSQALLAAQAANQAQPLQITVHGGR